MFGTTRPDNERFRDRADAGRRLAARLAAYAGREGVIVLALPRGGVPVAYEIARALRAPLDVFLVRKLGVPGQEELAMGALGPGGVRVLNMDVIEDWLIPDRVIEEVASQEQLELERRDHLYRGDRPAPHITGRTVILVDDGLATGSTMLAAVAALRSLRPARIVVAVPTGAVESCDRLRPEVDELVCLRSPARFHAISLWYDDFSATSDVEVRSLLQKAATPPHGEQKAHGDPHEEAPDDHDH